MVAICTTTCNVHRLCSVSVLGFIGAWELYQSQGSIVSTVTGLRAGWYEVQIQTGKRCFLSPKCPECVPSFLFKGCWRSLPGVKRLGHEVDHLLLSSAKVKNEWSSAGTPIWLYGLGRDSFIFMLYYKSCTRFWILPEDYYVKYIVLVSEINHSRAFNLSAICKMSEEHNVILFFIFKPLRLGKRSVKKGSGINMKGDLRKEAT